MAFFKKLRGLFKKFFSRPKRRRKNPARKVKRKPLKKSRPKRALKLKKPSVRKSVNSPQPLIGDITHFFPRIQVCVLKVLAGSIKVGQEILIAGKETRFTQKVASLQIESVDVQAARRGNLVGLKLDKPAKVGDKIFHNVN